jgi:sterol 14-demethylase
MGSDLIPVSIASACVSINTRELITLAATTFFLLALSCPPLLRNGRLFRSYNHEKEPPNIKLSEANTVRSFYRKRVDFLRDGFKQTGSWAFQFSLLRNRVIAVSGEEGRKILLRESGLDLYEGFQIVLKSVSHLIIVAYPQPSWNTNSNP